MVRGLETVCPVIRMMSPPSDQHRPAPATQPERSIQERQTCVENPLSNNSIALTNCQMQTIVQPPNNPLVMNLATSSLVYNLFFTFQILAIAIMKCHMYLEKYLHSVVARQEQEVVSVWIVATLFRVCIEPLYQLQQSRARTTHSPSLAGWNFQTIFRQLTFSSPPKWSQPPSAPTNANCFTAVAPLFFAPVSEDLLSTFRLIETIETLVPLLSSQSHQPGSGGWGHVNAAPALSSCPPTALNHQHLLLCSGATCYSTITFIKAKEYLLDTISI